MKWFFDVLIAGDVAGAETRSSIRGRHLAYTTEKAYMSWLLRHHALTNSYQGAVRRAAKECGVEKRVTPHVFRHSFSTHMLEGKR